MSVFHILVSGQPLPEIGSIGLSIRALDKSHIPLEADRHIQKPYVYDVEIAAGEKYLEVLREYLQENLPIGEEAELWSVYCGGDYSKHLKIRPRVSGLSGQDLHQLEEDMDRYAEENYHPQHWHRGISELQAEDINRFLTTTGSCLHIDKGQA